MTWFDWNTRPSPFSGFGDDQNSSVKFVHFTGWGEPLAAWQGGERKLNHFDIGDGQTVTQRGAIQPQTLTLRLWFATWGDLELMASLQGQSATLRYRDGSVVTRGGATTIQTIGDTNYVVLPETILTSLTDRGKQSLGFPEATATFWRPAVASPYVGFTTLAPEDA